MTNDNTSLLQSIAEKIARLQSLYETEKKKNKELNQTIKTQEEKIKKLENEILDIRYKNKMLGLSGTLNTTDKTEAKKALDKMIREIDKCIALIK